MRLSTREDVNAPVDRVFGMLTHFETFERDAMRRGADVRRLHDGSADGLGATWEVLFPLHGKERRVTVEVTELTPVTDLEVGIRSRNISGAATCTLLALNPTKTRLILSLEIRPLTLPARLLIQSLKLKKAKITRKYKTQITDLAMDIERRYSREA